MHIGLSEGTLGVLATSRYEGELVLRRPPHEMLDIEIWRYLSKTKDTLVSLNLTCVKHVAICLLVQLSVAVEEESQHALATQLELKQSICARVSAQCNA